MKTQKDLLDLQYKLVGYLADGGWHTWRDIKTDTGIRREDVRKMTLYTDGWLIGNAQDGIKLTEFAADDEVLHTLRAMNSHANEILVRAEAISGVSGVEIDLVHEAEAA